VARPEFLPQGGSNEFSLLYLIRYSQKTISYCIKAIDGRLIGQGTINADRKSLGEWAKGLTAPWIGAMEATLFTGWVYDFLKPYALELKVAHPEMLKSIVASKNKHDPADAEGIADLLRVNLLPGCHMLPEDIRELRLILRYRNLIVPQEPSVKRGLWERIVSGVRRMAKSKGDLFVVSGPLYQGNELKRI
jgi:hypothetical protein